MVEGLEEATRAIATVREKVVALLNSMTMYPLSLSRNSSNLHVSKVTLSLSEEATADVSKDTSTFAGNAGKAANNEKLQPSSDAPPPIALDVGIVQVDSHPRKSSEPGKETREPMHIDGDDSREESQMASASTINKGKAFLIEDSESDDNSQVTPINTQMDKGDALVLEPIDVYTVAKASGIDYL